MDETSNRDDIEDFFDRMAKSRDVTIRKDVIVDYEQRLRQQYIKELLNLNKNDVIIDAGCGNCRDAEFLISSTRVRPRMYIGIDLSRNMIIGCRAQSSSSALSLIQADLIKTPIKDGTATKLICSEVLEHIPRWSSVLEEFYRIIASRGDLIVSTPNIYSMYYPQKKVLEEKEGTIHPHDVWKSYWLLKEQLTKCGFDIADVRGSCYLPGLLSYRGKTRSVMERLLSRMEQLETRLLGGSPLKYFGYTIIIKARKLS